MFPIRRLEMMIYIMHDSLWTGLSVELIEFNIIYSSGSSGRVRGGRETWNLCSCLWRPSFLWLIFTGPVADMAPSPTLDPPLIYSVLFPTSAQIRNELVPGKAVLHRMQLFQCYVNDSMTLRCYIFFLKSVSKTYEWIFIIQSASVLHHACPISIMSCDLLS